MEDYMETEQLVEKLVSWIREKALSAECKGLVLGMSGGVDSSVLAILCHCAFPQNTLGVLMPCYSKKEDAEHARIIANKFFIPIKTVALDTIFDSLLKILPVESSDSNLGQLAKANIKPRLRMLTLYYFANQLKYLVAGSSNQDELTIGYFTKYGDGGADIIPLGNIVKGQVRELAYFLGVPQEIIDKPPSAGLWPGQTDEDDIGFSYEELDHYLVNGQATYELKKKIEPMITRSIHKLSPPIIPNFP
jgi:NAD+ synthase